MASEELQALYGTLAVMCEQFGKLAPVLQQLANKQKQALDAQKAQLAVATPAKSNEKKGQIKEKEIKEKEIKDKEIKDKEIKDKEIKDKEIKEKELEKEKAKDKERGKDKEKEKEKNGVTNKQDIDEDFSDVEVERIEEVEVVEVKPKRKAKTDGHKEEKRIKISEEDNHKEATKKNNELEKKEKKSEIPAPMPKQTARRTRGPLPTKFSIKETATPKEKIPSTPKLVSKPTQRSQYEGSSSDEF